MLKSLFISSQSGDILIEKHFQDRIPRNALEPILHTIKTQNKCLPMIDSFGIVFLIEKYNDIYLIGCCDSESSQHFSSAIVLNLANFLNSIIKGTLVEASVKMEYATIYKALDQAIDFGYPFFGYENAVFSSMIQSTEDTLQLDQTYPWRGTYAVKGSSEISVVACEHIETRINSYGKSDFLIIRGAINVHSKFAGQPIVRLAISIPHTLDDYAFHPCIDSSQYLSRRFSFVPPEGEFALMTYLTRPNLANLPVFITPTFTWSKFGVIFEISAKIESPLDFLTISFTMPKGVANPSLAVSSGAVFSTQEGKGIKWNIGNVSKPTTVKLNGSASLSCSDSSEMTRFIVIETDFAITGTAASGLKIESIEVEGFPKVSKSISHVTRAGNYIFTSSQ